MISKVFLALFVILLPAVSFSDDLRLYYWNSKTDYFDLIDFTASSRIPRGFNVAEKTVVIIHGFSDSIHTERYRTFARRIKAFEPKTNVLALDWLDSQNVLWLPGTDPVSAASIIPEVADWTYERLFYSDKGLRIRAQNLHIIGFSHGAHVAALIGKRASGYIAHLTILDPSPRKSHVFSGENFLGNGWSASESGKFVDMYKTSKWAATSSCRGHLSFLVREKGTLLQENSIDEVYANHLYTFHWYMSTIGKRYENFGYSLKIPDKPLPESKTWTGTIFSSLPKNPSPEDYDTATDSFTKN